MLILCSFSQRVHPDESLLEPANQHKISGFMIVDKSLMYSSKDAMQTRFNSNLLDIVAVDGQPFNFVAGAGFKNTILDLNARVNIPSETTMRRRLTDKVKSQV